MSKYGSLRICKLISEPVVSVLDQVRERGFARSSGQIALGGESIESGFEMMLESDENLERLVAFCE